MSQPIRSDYDCDAPQSPPAGDELDEILRAYKRYPYGTSELPHISGDEAVAAINAYILAQFLELIGEDEPLGDWREVSAASNYKVQYTNLLRAELRQAATARFGGKS